MKVPVVGVGAGGHARVVIEILRCHEYEVVALVDPNPTLWQTAVAGVPVIGDDSLLPSLVGRVARHAFIGVGGTGSTWHRRRLYELALRAGFDVVDAIHPQAIVSPTAVLGSGATVMAAAVINACARIGTNVIINTGAIVEHDCVIGDHVHIATGARLASTVEIGSGAHIGAGATIRQSIAIGRNVILGAGAVVVADLPDSVVAVGVPARVIRTVADADVLERASGEQTQNS